MRVHLSLLRALLGLALGFALVSDAAAQTFQDSRFSSEVVVTLPQLQPVGVAWAPDGAMFIWQRNGIIRVFHSGVLLPTPFLDISSRVNTFNDRGLLSFAFDPRFDQNGYVYLSYTYEPSGNPSDNGSKTVRLSRFTANPSNPDVALSNSEVILIGTFPDDGTTHTQGSLLFAPDGTLFFGYGDGASPNTTDPLAAGVQDLNSLRGKILRLNPDGSAPAPPQLTNPFYDGTNSIRSRVWAYGVRNPFRFDRHPILDDLYGIDVGWNTWEEVNRLSPGKNYGWPCYEGVNAQPDYQTLLAPLCSTLPPSAVTPPIFTYSHSTLGTCATSGGFYTANSYPSDYTNNFFFSDYSGGWIRRLVLDASGNIAQNLLFASNAGSVTSMKTGPDGLLYYTEFLSGEVRRVRFRGVSAVASAVPSSGYSPLSVAFSSAGSTDGLGGTLTYAWSFGDGTTSTQANPQHTYTSASVQTFNATLTARNSAGDTSVAPVAITVGSLPPVPVISAPQDGTSVQPGTVVNYAGSATDPDDGVIPGSTLQWEVRLHHNTHVHPGSTSTGPTGSFVAAYHGIGTYSYELRLTATDSSGLSTTTSVSVPVLPDTTPPSTPLNLVATASGSWAVNLGWTASTDNGVVALYHVERCLGATCGNFAEIATALSNAYADSGLSPSTAYSYRVRAEDGDGNLGPYSDPATATTAAGPPQNPGLVAAYGFEEPSGSGVVDTSGNNNVGTLSGATRTASGKFGAALSFNGTNAWVSVPDSASLDLTTGMTLEAWVNPSTTTSNWRDVIYKINDIYYLEGTSTLGSAPAMGGTFSPSPVYGTSALPSSTWSHLAATYDGTTMRLYVNGTQVASRAQTGLIRTSNSALGLGGDSLFGQYWSGLIDEVRVYNRALSVSEITQDMNTPVGAPAVCGNGVVEGSEPCDAGAANGTPGSCCTATCQIALDAHVCRAANGVCDVAETCTGSSGSCPADGFKAAGVQCAAALGVCDLPETCTGSSAACPADGPNRTTVCREAAGICDVAESCSDASNDCPADALAIAGTPCRPSAGACDLAETCSGGAATCPADAFAASGTACGDPSASVCDSPDSCNGSGACQPNHAPTTTQCRPSIGTCDPAENCDGAGTCPADAFAAAGTPCGSSSATACTNPDTCSSTGVCLTNDQPCAEITDADLCPFDVGQNVCDSAAEDAFTQQFRLTYTPEIQNSPVYQLGLATPADSFYNAIVRGTPGSSQLVTFTVPYPYVTVGAEPLRVFDAANVETGQPSGCFLTHGAPLATAGPSIALGNYLALCDTALGLCRNGVGACTADADCVRPNASGVTCVAPTGTACGPTPGPDAGGSCSFSTSIQLPASGEAYVNLHLDYGLQGPLVDLCRDGSLERYNWAVNPVVGGLDALDSTAHDVAIANCTDYTFQHSVGAGPALQATVENLNDFSVCDTPGDRDCDGLPDAVDECPYYAGNAPGADADGDGRGDACECGDQNGDGHNDVLDLLAINEAIFKPDQVTPLCDANNDGLCNVNDILAANIEIYSVGSTSTCARQPVPGP